MLGALADLIHETTEASAKLYTHGRSPSQGGEEMAGGELSARRSADGVASSQSRRDRCWLQLKCFEKQSMVDGAGMASVMEVSRPVKHVAWGLTADS